MRPVRTVPDLQAALADVDGVIVDLTARAYDGVAAIQTAAAAGRPVMAVGQHDDRALRPPGAGRRCWAGVHPYRRLFEDGPRQIGAWLSGIHAVEPIA